MYFFFIPKYIIYKKKTSDNGFMRVHTRWDPQYINYKKKIISENGFMRVHKKQYIGIKGLNIKYIIIMDKSS